MTKGQIKPIELFFRKKSKRTHLPEIYFWFTNYKVRATVGLVHTTQHQPYDISCLPIDKSKRTCTNSA